MKFIVTFYVVFAGERGNYRGFPIEKMGNMVKISSLHPACMN